MVVAISPHLKQRLYIVGARKRKGQILEIMLVLGALTTGES